MASRAKKPTKSQEGSSRAARLAKENDISIEEEAEIRETFRLFARTTPRRRRRRQRREEDEDDDEKDEDDDDDDDEYDDGQGQEDADEDGEGVMAIGDVRRALMYVCTTFTLQQHSYNHSVIPCTLLSNYHDSPPGTKLTIQPAP